MGTTPIKPKTDQDGRIESNLRLAIAGHPQGAVRRILLWVAAFTGLVAAIFVIPTMTFAVAVALTVTFVALLLLALSDQLA